MSLSRLLSRLVKPLACTALLLAAATSAVAGGATMKPMLRLGPQEQSAGVMSMGAGAQYGLFTCQVVGRASLGDCYDPYQMRKAYQLDGLIGQGYDGAGQTIVIVDAFSHPRLQQQMAFFDSFYGLPPVQLTQVAPDGVVPFDPTDGTMLGWAEEISLDVEWAHAMAPGAKIVLVLARTSADSDILSAIKYAVDNDLGNIISMSFGANENCVDSATHQAYHDVFAQATRKHITLLASSADQGAALPDCDGMTWVKAVSSPAVDPLVTAVGGTELTAARYCLSGCDPSTHPAFGTFQSEIVWNEGPKYGDFDNVFGNTGATGGGYSNVFGAPDYQRATLRSTKQRAIPDVAYNAAVLHGVLTYLDIPGIGRGFFRFGGTSAGAPQWAALMAIANERAGRPLGFINNAIYQIGRMPVYGTSFNDTVSGSNGAIEFDASNNPVDITGFSAGAGWDASTGQGSPMSAALVPLLAKYVSPGDAVDAVNSTAKLGPTISKARRVTPH